MPPRRRLSIVHDRRVYPICFKISDGTHGFTGDDVFPDRESARKAWPDYRRETWAIACRGSMPVAAEVFDGFTELGARYLNQHWPDKQFDLDAALAAIE